MNYECGLVLEPHTTKNYENAWLLSTMSKSKPITVKKFITLSCEAIKTLTKENARDTYKSIKNKKNSIWTEFKDVEHALALKCKLNERVEDLEDELDDNPEDADKYQAQLNKLLTKASTLKLIKDLSIGYNTKILSISDQLLADIPPNTTSSEAVTKSKKKSIKSTNSEDSDDDSAIFSFEAYMKLKKQNTAEINKQSDDNDKNNAGNSEADDVFPVDQDANYQIISKHFVENTTKHDNIDHSVLNFDDLQSIHLRESDDSSESASSDYADSKMSINTKGTETLSTKHVCFVL